MPRWLMLLWSQIVKENVNATLIIHFSKGATVGEAKKFEVNRIGRPEDLVT